MHDVLTEYTYMMFLYIFRIIVLYFFNRAFCCGNYPAPCGLTHPNMWVCAVRFLWFFVTPAYKPPHSTATSGRVSASFHICLRMYTVCIYHQTETQHICIINCITHCLYNSVCAFIYLTKKPAFHRIGIDLLCAIGQFLLFPYKRGTHTSLHVNAYLCAHIGYM